MLEMGMARSRAHLLLFVYGLRWRTLLLLPLLLLAVSALAVAALGALRARLPVKSIREAVLLRRL